MLKMRNLWVVGAAIVVLAIGVVASADVSLYKGDPVPTSGITLGGWGSGSAIETSKRYFVGNRSIEITTQGLHEGGRIDFKQPIDVLQGAAGQGDYLEFVLGFATINKMGAGAGVTTSGPGFGAVLSSAQYGFGAAGGFYDQDEIPTRPKINSVRIVLESEEGRSVDATAEVPASGEDGWYKIGVPFKTLGLVKGEPFKVSRVMIFGDSSDTIYVGQIGTIRDASPITVEPLEEQVWEVNDPMTFEAIADGGAALLKYSWNFGDRDPDGVDATGTIVSHAYRKGTTDASGNDNPYILKLTVSDVWGIKKPVTVSAPITVND